MTDVYLHFLMHALPIIWKRARTCHIWPIKDTGDARVSLELLKDGGDGTAEEDESSLEESPTSVTSSPTTHAAAVVRSVCIQSVT